MFLSDKLPKTIKQFTPLKNQWFLNYDLTEKKTGDKKSNIDEDLILTSYFYIGASYDNNNIINDVKNIYIGKPIINEQIIDNKKSKDDDQYFESRQLYPNEALLPIS